MSRIAGSLPATSQNAEGAAKALGEVDLDQFIQLMIAELQNQDPLDPLDNSEMLQQITQIREIGSNDQLAETLQAVLTGQNLTTASSLIGQHVNALSDSGENLEGLVDRVSIEVDEDDTSKREIKVHIGDKSVALNNVREIVRGEE